ncbi:hypothetical protein MEO39_26690, partial [Dolichospermum sp. ST_sed2]|nr:hypothetical protein [Dolichospermum sp. ST_sed2]
RFLESEAGNRAQSDIRCGVTLVLMGSSHGETEPRKATHSKGRTQHQNPDFIGVKSRRTIGQVAARVQGFQWLNWLHLTERTILPREQIKTD